MCVQVLLLAVHLSNQNQVMSLLQWAMPQSHKTWFSFQINLWFLFSKPAPSVTNCLLIQGWNHEPGRQKTSGENFFFSFSVLSTHRCGAKRSIWQRSVSGIHRMCCPSPLISRSLEQSHDTPAAVISQNVEATLANFSPNHDYVGWVTWAPFTALQLCESNCCALGSQFIKRGHELSASLTSYNNSSGKANNAWEQRKVILWNRRWELYSSEFPLRESGLTKCSCQIWLESEW